VERALDHRAQHRLDLAQPPQRRRQQQAHEGTVARVELREARVTRERLVERLAPVQACRQHVERDLAGIFHFVAGYKLGMFAAQTNWERKRLMQKLAAAAFGALAAGLLATSAMAQDKTVEPKISIWL